jgi:hypothetical protein
MQRAAAERLLGITFHDLCLVLLPIVVYYHEGSTHACKHSPHSLFMCLGPGVTCEGVTLINSTAQQMPSHVCQVPKETLLMNVGVCWPLLLQEKVE